MPYIALLDFIDRRSSPEIAYWTSDHWVADWNPLRGMINRYFHLIVPCACLAQFNLNNVIKRGIKQNHAIFYLILLI